MDEKDFRSDDVRAPLKPLAQAAIHDMIGQYFYSLDRRDFGALTACFTSGVTFLVIDDSGGKGRILVRGLREKYGQSYTAHSPMVNDLNK